MEEDNEEGDEVNRGQEPGRYLHIKRAEQELEKIL